MAIGIAIGIGEHDIHRIGVSGPSGQERPGIFAKARARPMVKGDEPAKFAPPLDQISVVTYCMEFPAFSGQLSLKAGNSGPKQDRHVFVAHLGSRNGHRESGVASAKRSEQRHALLMAAPGRKRKPAASGRYQSPPLHWPGLVNTGIAWQLIPAQRSKSTSARTKHVGSYPSRKPRSKELVNLRFGDDVCVGGQEQINNGLHFVPVVLKQPAGVLQEGFFQVAHSLAGECGECTRHVGAGAFGIRDYPFTQRRGLILQNDLGGSAGYCDLEEFTDGLFSFFWRLWRADPAHTGQGVGIGCRRPPDSHVMKFEEAGVSHGDDVSGLVDRRDQLGVGNVQAIKGEFHICFQ